jgi:hypothetical protein
VGARQPELPVLGQVIASAIIADSGVAVGAFRCRVWKFSNRTLEASAQAAYGKLCVGALCPCGLTDGVFVQPKRMVSAGLPSIAALALVMVGLGLVGMTAGDLPGIAEQLAAPRWLMGALGGVLVGAGWQASRTPAQVLLRRSPPWVELVGFAVAGIVLARLSDWTRHAGGATEAIAIGAGINAAARILFGIGLGIVLGYVAFQASQARQSDDKR